MTLPWNVGGYYYYSPFEIGVDAIIISVIIFSFETYHYCIIDITIISLSNFHFIIKYAVLITYFIISLFRRANQLYNMRIIMPASIIMNGHQ